MAIDAYVGLPRNGKSYGVVEHVIIPSLKQNRHVVTNIPLNIDALLMDFGGTIKQLPDDWYELDDLSEYALPGCVLVLDEAWRRWPSGLTINQASFQDKSLFAEHGHKVNKNNKTMRIVIVTQDLSQISNWIRVLIQSTYRVAKKGKNFYVVSIYSGAVTGNRPPKNALLRQATGRFKKHIFVYYSSATQSETGDVGDESTADSRASILKSWGLWGLLSIVVFGSIFGIYGITSFFSPKQVENPVISQPKATEPVKPFKPASNVAAAVFSPAVEGLRLSPLWRVTGYVKAAKKRSKLSSEMLGLDYVEVNERAVIFNGSRSRFIPLDQCDFFEGGFEIYCDVDGERITSYSGGGAVTTVFQSANNQLQPDLTR